MTLDSHRPTGLRLQVIVALSALFAVLLSLLWAVANNVVTAGFVAVERAEAGRSLERALSAMERNADDLQFINGDWAAWDDAFGYATGQDNGFVDDNLNEPSFTRLRIDFVIITDQQRRIRIARGYDAAKSVWVDTPQELLDLAARTPVGSSAEGFLQTAAGPLVFAAAAIVPSSAEKRYAGTIVMARRVAETILPELRRTMVPELSIVTPAVAALALRRARAAAPTEQVPYGTDLTDPDRLVGYGTIRDVAGTPIFAVRTESRREVNAQARRTSRYLLGSIVLTGAVVLALALVFLERRVLGPLRVMGESLERFRDTGSDGRYVARIEKSHELAVLGDALNGAVDAMRESLASTRAREVAERANSAKSDFLARMSHEIRTPMNGVLGLLELVQGMSLGDRQRHLIATARGSAESLLRIINDILDFSKIDAGRLELRSEIFDLRAVATTVIDVFEGTARSKGLELCLLLDAALPARVCGDQTRLRQVLTNLVGNAVKFTDAGRVSLCIKRLADSNADEILEFVIEDTGCGIAAEAQPQMFEPFVQAQQYATRRHGGTGLGLAISRQLVELMGGEIGFTSEPGRGSRFRFTIRAGCVAAGCVAAGAELPTAAAAAASATGAGVMPAASTELLGMHVLVVEDNPVNRMVATGSLDSLGCTWDIAEDGAIALEKLRAAHFDVVLMDCQMPVLDGFAATEELRRREASSGAARQQVIALTANAMQGDQERCLLAGMDGFISKPFSRAQLAEALLLARRPAPRAIAQRSLDVSAAMAVSGKSENRPSMPRA